MRTRVGGLVLVLLALTLGACAGDDATLTASTTTTAKPAGPSVKLTVGDKTSGAVDFSMTASGITIEPAGEVHEHAGHFHLIADHGCHPVGTVIPKDADHVHLGKGQMEGKIYLAPGEHKLCLQVGDGAHTALNITDTKTVTVDITSQDEWCGAIGDLNGLYEGLAALAADFPGQQLSYANVQRLVAQLTGGIGTIPGSARKDVLAELGETDRFAQAFVDAKDAAGAEKNVNAYFPKGRDEDTPGRTWISENCPA